MQSQPPPKGSLEELFRHHLLESEAAAVPPRPLVWEHIDNGLLQAQNEKYRRRLLAYRWGMAASLLLATLAGGGWWHSQQQATATLASANAQHEAARHAVAGAVPAGPRSYASPSEATAPAVAPGAAQGSVASSEAQASAGRTLAASTATTSRTRHQATAEATTAGLAGRGKGQLAAGSLAYATRASERLGYGAGRAAAGVALAHSSTVYPSHSYSIAATATPSPAASASSLASTAPLNASAEAPLPGTASSDNTLAANAATSRLGEDALATRLASLAMPPATGLPTELAMQALPAPTPALLRRWRYGAAYTIGAFQPNIDFNRSTTAYNTSLGSNTISLTRAAAAEYRANLRPGLSQRLGLRATRWLGGHWSLSTGVELAQQEAYSATSSAFTGEQLGDLNNFAAIPSTGPASSPPIYSRSLQESSFRYRSAGVPIELQYDNQAKPGLSFYGRLGAIVSALLSAHSEVAGNSEATRTYSLTSASTPYRRLTALLRGSAGVRYRPAGRTWSLNVGPTAEAGVQSMNAETDRNFWQQSRPYSVGIEAGIEFGSFKPVQ